ncbi:hypothetical protein LJC52_05635, partial [Bacteroidales bacterium OttesenSCG-928-A17]|nr:hypothetical protein [Bacteroidales bacterium OttesenSCG-928-A17]
GYDAPACAAIAKEVGCDIALTFNAPLKYKNDSGAEIAKMLGYTNVICLNANSYINRKDLIEAEFISSGELGTGIVFSSLEEYIKDSIVFFGERGDKIWDKNRKDVNNVFCFEDELYSNTSIIENRLKVGYILLPLPLFGASQWSSLHSISNSNEMKEYSIGGNYDRPIPRRILESRGIKRELFGQEKKGAGFNYRFDNVKRLRKRMSQHSFQYFYSFYKRDTFSGKRYMCLLSFYWKSKYYYIHHIFRLLKINLPIPKRNEIISNPGAPLSLFKWSILIMKKKYKQQ